MRYIVILLFLLPQIVRADDDWKSTCKTVSNIAQTIMQERQDGVSMATLIGMSKGNETFESLVIAAYDSPRYSTDEMKRKAIENFRDNEYLSCVKAFRDSGK